MDLNKTLWGQFKNKINEEWSIYSKDNESFEELRNQFKFAKQVKERIDYITDQKDAISDITIKRYLKDDRLPDKISKKSLDTIAKYIGHESYDDFVDTQLQKPSITQIAINESNASKTRICKHYFTAASLFVLLLITIAWGVSGPRIDQDEIEELIIKANKAEFEVYNTLSDSSMENLHQYFTLNGTAYNEIAGVFERSKEKERKLQTPPSSQVIYEIKILNHTKQTVDLRTKEHWILRWYDPTEDTELLYDVSNIQFYHLVKDDDQWKIAVNTYGGKVRIPATEELKNQ